MEIITTIAAMQQYSKQKAREGKSIGVVPTMGCLHDGHIALVKTAKKLADCVIVTLFVNPTQFGPNEDFTRYPRDFESDRIKCEANGAEVLFAPNAAEMYQPGSSTWVVEEELSQGLCGRSRPGHFRGVTTVVAKLFNATLPDVAVFGQKDAQQALVIRRMTENLNFPVRIVIAPIVREADGMAMSSRNRYLSEDERSRAAVISASLRHAAQELHHSALPESAEVLEQVKTSLLAAGGRIDYVELCDADNLAPASSASKRLLLAIAVFFGKTRLIDNVIIELGEKVR